jgi:hypothetical protein
MPLLEDVKKFAEKATGRGRPARETLRGLVRRRKPNTFRFKDDGCVLNNPS